MLEWNPYFLLDMTADGTYTTIMFSEVEIISTCLQMCDQTDANRIKSVTQGVKHFPHYFMKGNIFKTLVIQHKTDKSIQSVPQTKITELKGNDCKVAKCFTLKTASPLLAWETVFGRKFRLTSRWITGSLYFLASARLKPWTVFLKFVTACCLAEAPNALSLAPNDTYDLQCIKYYDNFSMKKKNHLYKVEHLTDLQG